MKKMHSLVVLIGLVFALFGTALQAENVIRGQVTDSVTGATIEGATLELKLDPPGVPEVVAEDSADFFGLYSVEAPTVATHTVTASHEDYETQTMAVLPVLDGAVSVSFELVRKPSSFTRSPKVTIEVSDVKTDTEMNEVTVKVEVFHELADVTDGTGPSKVYELETDDDGRVVIKTGRIGYYRFTINDEPGGGPGRKWKQWDKYTTVGTADDLRYVDVDTLVNMALKPKDNTLRIRVKGPNPRKDPDAGTGTLPVEDLEGHQVEVTGLHFSKVRDAGGVLIDVISEVTPPRTRLTGSNGVAAFGNLAAVPYRVVLRRPGYAPVEEVVFPDPTTEALLGNDGTDIKEIIVPFIPGVVAAIIIPEYFEPEVMKDVPFVLEGLEKTNTAKIKRTLSLDPLDPMSPTTRTFDHLLPGMYRLSVNAKPGALNTGMVKPHFVAETLVEVPLDIAGAPPVEIFLPVKAQRPTVRVRVFAALDKSTLKGDEGKSIFRPMATDIVEFIEYIPETVAGPSADLFLGTDARGEVTTTPIPAVYGFKLPDLLDFAAHHAKITDVTAGTVTEQGWPYGFAWPFPGDPPANGTPNAGAPILFESGKEYIVDLFVVSHEVTVQVPVVPDPDSPLATQTFGVGTAAAPAPASGLTRDFGADALQNDGLVALDATGAGSPITSSLAGRDGANAIATFLDIPSGPYEVMVTHPRFTMTHPGGAVLSLTVPSWATAGDVPLSDPGDGSFIKPHGVIKTAPVTSSFDIKTGREITINTHNWNAGDEEWVLFSTVKHKAVDPLSPTAFPYMKIDAGDDQLFYNDGSPGSTKMPAGGFTYWTTSGTPKKWYKFHVPFSTTTITHDIFRGPPGGNADTGPTTADAELVLKAVSEGDPLYTPAGTTFTGIAGAGGGMWMPGDVIDITGVLPVVTMGNVLNSKWSMPAATAEMVLVDPTVPRFEATARLTKGGIKATGTVKRFSSMGDKVVPGAMVTFFNRWGKALGSAKTDSDGKFFFDGLPGHKGLLPNAGMIYLEVTSPGFGPWLLRIPPTSPLYTGEGDGVADPRVFVADEIFITPLHAPIHETDGRPGSTMVELDRFGLFVPGVTMSSPGQTPIVTPLKAEAELTAVWSTKLTTHVFPNTQPKFDLPSGSAGPHVPDPVRDDIVSVWLIDCKGFEGEPLNISGDPASPTAKVHDIVLPDLEDPAAKTAWLEDIKDGRFTQGSMELNVFVAEAELIEEDVPEGARKATGTLKLWEMPPGEYRPYLVALTTRGTVLITPKIDYNYSDNMGAEANFILHGAQLPGYVIDTLNILGGIAHVSDKRAVIHGILPQGNLTSLGSFTGTISAFESPVGSMDYKFIDYNYEFAVSLKQGMDTPGKKILGYAARKLGTQADTSIKLGIAGFEKTAELSGAQKFSAEYQDKQKIYVPGAVRSFDPQTTIVPAFDWKLSNSDHLSSYDRVNTKNQLTVGGQVGVFCRANLRPLTSKLPYGIGQVMAALDRFNALNLFADLTGGGRVQSRTSFSTLRPEQDWNDGTWPSTESVPPFPPEPAFEPRFNFMGGSEMPAEMGFDQFFDIYFHMGMGMTGKMLAGQIEGSAGLQLAGGADGTTITLKVPDNRTLQKVTGVGEVTNVSGGTIPAPTAQLTVELTEEGFILRELSFGLLPYANATLHTPLKRFKKEVDFSVIPFVASLNTVPVFTITQMGLKETVVSFSGCSEVSYAGTTPQLIRSGLPFGAEFRSATGAGGTGLVFADKDDVTGEMLLKFAAKTGATTWGAPTTIVAGGGIADALLAPLSGGGWLAVWSEISAAAVSDLFAAETVKYSVGNAAGTSWSAPATAFSSSGVSRELRWAETPGGTGAVVFLEGMAGPSNPEFAIRLLPWTGAAFGAPVLVKPAGDALIGFDAVGDGLSVAGKTVIGYSGGDESVKTVTWDGTTVSAETTHAGNSAGPIDLATHDGTFGAYLFWSANDGAVRGAGLSGAGAWTAPVDLSTSVAASDLRFEVLDDPVGGDVIFGVWASGADTPELQYSFFSLGGGPLVDFERLTTNARGGYSGLDVVPGPGRSVDVLARYQHDDSQIGQEVRSFHVTFADGVDVGNDRDTDGLNDIVELNIVDADLFDSLMTIDDVLPGDDADGDGFDNMTEIAAGSDALDPGSVPPSPGVTVVAAVQQATEQGSQQGEFEVRRGSGDDASAELTVNLSVAGTAGGGDYVAVPASIIIPVGLEAVRVPILPIEDTLAEGTETVIMTVDPGAGYTVGAPAVATVSIIDRPFDLWRTENFTAAQLADPLLSGPDSDLDADGRNAFWEYAIGTDPTVNELDGEPSIALEQVTTGVFHLCVTYDRRSPTADLEFDVEMSTELASWDPMNGNFDVLSITDNGDGTERVKLRSRAPISTDVRNFVRVNASRK